jgi:selenocysteine lyase/cysteine desulfurase
MRNASTGGDDVDWDALRKREFPVTERWAYFDHAAVAPLPKRSGDMLRAWAAEQEANGVVNWLDWERKLETTRGRCATLIRSDPDEIAFVNSTTHGIGIVAEGFPWQDGDNVVTAAEEYPSNVYPWMNLASRGVSLRLVPSRDGRVPIEDLIAAMDARTRVLTISHVEWSTGFRNDLDALGAVCRDRGIALFVDAIQGLGPLTIDVARTPIDFLCADGHKWLLGPEGAGLLYVRREWIDRLRPIGVGWHSVVSSFNTPGFDFTLKPSAQRWEGGSFNMPGLQCFGASLELLAEIGREAVSERILDRAARVRDIARQCDWSVVGSQTPGDLSGIVALEKPGIDPNRFALEARARQVAIACRRGKIRVSPHIYNNDDDLERLAETLRGREGVSR